MIGESLTHLHLAVVVSELVQTVIYASIAGIGLTLVFSIAIFGASKCADYGREERFAAAIFSGVVAAVALLTCLGAVAVGIYVMAE